MLPQLKAASEDDNVARKVAIRNLVQQPRASVVLLVTDKTPLGLQLDYYPRVVSDPQIIFAGAIDGTFWQSISPSICGQRKAEQHRRTERVRTRVMSVKPAAALAMVALRSVALSTLLNRRQV